ncbi:MAG: alpha/beta hydrolase [Sporolactobacillus sp.]
MNKLNGIIFLAIVISLTVSWPLANHLLSHFKSPKTQQALAEKKHAVIKKQKTQGIPTVFIHGWTGTQHTFQAMIDNFTADYKGPQLALIVHVRPDGTVTQSGKLGKQLLPLIQIIFDNNRGTIEQQAAWLKQAFHVLKVKDGIDRMNVVSHSMGGQSFTYYLETIASPKDYPLTEKYVAIAAPFDWANGPQDDTEYTLAQLKQRSILYQKRAQIPSQLKVLAIAGVMRDARQGDGRVGLQSAFFGQYLFNPAKYSEQIIHGPKAQHSKLHENPAVNRLIAKFLWQQKPQK